MIKEFIDQLEKKEDLDFHSMQSAIEFIMTGERQLMNSWLMQIHLNSRI